MSGDSFGLLDCVIENRYRVDTVVGEGGFGIVYRGWHLAFGHAVAIKCLKVPAHFTAEARATFLKRFREEGAFLSALSAHPAIVRVFDLNVIEGPARQAIPYLVMEWLEGRELEQLLQERRHSGLGAISEAEALTLLRPAVEALKLAHELKIVHRDLKPRNLYLADTRRGVALKVLDFGIAKALQDGELATRLATGTTSAFDAFTPEYAAPEQFEGHRFGGTGPWTDVYAFGMILTELVLGRRAYQGETVFSLYGEATGSVRPTPRALGVRVSDAFERLCARALAVESVDRFPDAGALLDAFDETYAAAASAASNVVESGAAVGQAGDSREEPAVDGEAMLDAMLASGDVGGEGQVLVPSSPTHMVMAGPAPRRSMPSMGRAGFVRILGLLVGLGVLVIGAVVAWPGDYVGSPTAGSAVPGVAPSANAGLVAPRMTGSSSAHASRKPLAPIGIADQSTPSTSASSSVRAASGTTGSGAGAKAPAATEAASRVGVQSAASASSLPRVAPAGARPEPPRPKPRPVPPSRPPARSPSTRIPVPNNADLAF